MCLFSRFLDLPPGWPQTIALLADQDQRLNSSPRSASLLKKQTKLSSGSRCFWTAEWFGPEKLKNLLAEATQLVAIFTASRKTAKSWVLSDSARSRRFRAIPAISLLQCVLHKRSYVLLQLAQRRILDIHHVSGAVIAQADFCVLGRVKRHVIERVLRGEVWSGQIEVT